MESSDQQRRTSPTWVSEAGLPATLLALRERDGRTQKQVAVDAGVSPATIARLESGDRRPSRNVLAQLAAAYEITPDQLLAAAERIDAGEDPKEVLDTLPDEPAPPRESDVVATAAAEVPAEAGSVYEQVQQHIHQRDALRQRTERQLLAALDRLSSDDRRRFVELVDDLTARIRTRGRRTDLDTLHDDVLELLRGYDDDQTTIALLPPGEVRSIQHPGFARDERGTFWIDPAARARAHGTDSLDPRIERYDDGRFVLDISRIDPRIAIARRDPARHLLRASVQGSEATDLPASLDMQYAEAELVIDLPDAVRLTITPTWDGTTPGQLPDALPTGTRHLHIISAANPRGRLLTASENTERTHMLARQLTTDGHHLLTAEARSPDGSWIEPAFAILDADLADILHLAEAYEQSAIYEITAQQRRIMWTQSDREPIQQGWREAVGTTPSQPAPDQ